MTISNYLCAVIGEEADRVRRLHISTQRRLKTYAMAIHIPVALWALTGYAIGSRVFGLSSAASAVTALFCATLIFLVERLVLATPKAWFVNIGRVFIGVVISFLGATVIDLVIFEREVAQQLKQAGEERINGEFERSMAAQQKLVDKKKDDWMKAQEAANCEANGTCGSRVRSVGPVYRQLARQASLLRKDYEAAQVQLEALAEARTKALEDWRNSPRALEEAGLLSRIEALHQYTVNNEAAFMAWGLFFVLVLFFELMVVFAKLVFGETVDDQLERIREQVSHHKAQSYLEAVTSPLAGVNHLLECTTS